MVFATMGDFLTKEEKVAKYEEFIASDQFTNQTWISLILIDRNVSALANVVELEFDLLQRIPIEETSHKFIQLDILAKTMMIIETSLRCNYALVGEKNEFPNNFSDPKLKLVGICSDLIGDEEPIQRVWKILAYPLPHKLDLPAPEKDFLCSFFKKSCQHVYGIIKDMGGFFENHRIAYNKLKHSMMILDYKLEDTSEELILSLAYGRPKLRPPCYIEGNVSPVISKLFNVGSFISRAPSLLQFYVHMAKANREIISNIVSNNLTWAENLGENYFPAKVSYLNGKVTAFPRIYALKTTETIEQDMDRLGSIYDRIWSAMNITARRFNPLLGLRLDDNLKSEVKKNIMQYGIAVIGPK